LQNQEPRLLCFDAFALHKNKGQKAVEKESTKAKEKRLVEEQPQQELRNKFSKLNVTTSIIHSSCTGYIQVLDVSVNKIIKQYIEEFEDLHIDNHIEQWKARRYSVGDRRILMTEWVAKAWEKLHIEHKDTIIKTFRQVGLSLNPDSSEDSELSIRDLPGITVGNYTKAQNSIIVPNDNDNVTGCT